MALKQIQQISIEVLGDGTSTTFSFSLSSYAGNVASATKSTGQVLKEVSARFPLTLDYAGTTQDRFTLCVTGLGATAVSFGSMSWSEVR